MSDGWPHVDSPFHAGEQQVQDRLGVRDIEDWARKIVRPYLPEQHRAFHTALPFLIVAAQDSQGARGRRCSPAQRALSRLPIRARWSSMQDPYPARHSKGLSRQEPTSEFSASSSPPAGAIG